MTIWRRYWPWWVWIGFTAVYLGGYQLIAYLNGWQLLSWQVWEATDRYVVVPYVVLTPIVILVVHFWVIRDRVGWWIGIALTLPLWLHYARRRAPRGGPMSQLSFTQQVKERPLWLPAVVGIIVQIAASYGFDLDREWLAGTLLLVVGLVTYWQQRKVTSVAKLERLEENNVIVTHPRIADGVVDVLKAPTDNVPTNLPPVPPAPSPVPIAKD